MNGPRGVPGDSDVIRLLGLTRTMLVRRGAAADACAAYHDATKASAAMSATMAVLAASCWTPIDSLEGQARWRGAYDRYRLTGHSFSGVLSVCAGVGQDEKELADPMRTAIGIQCRLLSLAWLSSLRPEYSPEYYDQVQRLHPKIEEFGGQFAGQLGLPLRQVHLFAASACNKRPNRAAFFSAQATAEHLLRRAADIVRAAQKDQYHWQRILPGFMPIEPEWLALGRIIYHASDRFGLEIDRKSTSSLDQLERLPLVIAASMPPPESAEEYRDYPSPPDGAMGNDQSNKVEDWSSSSSSSDDDE